MHLRCAPLLLLHAIESRDHSVVPLVRLQGQLLLRLEPVLLQLSHLAREDCLGRDCGVDAVRLDGDDEGAAGLEEVARVQGDDARLIGLRDVREDNVYHTDQHAVFLRVPRILDDGDDVRSLLRHVHQVAAGAVGELNGEHAPGGANNV